MKTPQLVIEDLKNNLDFPLIFQEIEAFWKQEQAKRHAFYELVHEDHKAEFINGEIIFHSLVRNKHWVACTRLGARLSIFVDEQDLGIVGVEKVMIRCNRNDYEPDIVFFGKEKASKFTPDLLIFPPCDLAVEVLSESTRKHDYGVKFEDYAAHGIAEYWIVNTDEQSIEQYILREKTYYLQQKLSQNGVLKSLIIKGFEIEISQVFK